MRGNDPYSDLEGAPFPTQTHDDRRTPVLDWRIVLFILGLLYVLGFSYLNAESEAVVRLVFCGDVTLSVVAILLLGAVIGAVLTLIAQSGYRRYRSRKAALEEAARAAFGGGGGSEGGNA